jgi:hypothetical protein
MEPPYQRAAFNWQANRLQRSGSSRTTLPGGTCAPSQLQRTASICLRHSRVLPAVSWFTLTPREKRRAS